MLNWDRMSYNRQNRSVCSCPDVDTCITGKEEERLEPQTQLPFMPSRPDCGTVSRSTSHSSCLVELRASRRQTSPKEFRVFFNTMGHMLMCFCSMGLSARQHGPNPTHGQSLPENPKPTMEKRQRPLTPLNEDEVCLHGHE